MGTAVTFATSDVGKQNTIKDFIGSLLFNGRTAIS